MQLSNDVPCSVCGRYNNRRIAVDALIIKDNTILLIKRAVDPFKDLWALPGGGLDFDETAEQALQKEVGEEVGLEITSLKFFKTYTDPHRDPKQVITLVFSVETTGEAKAGSDARECKFFPLDNLPEVMAFDHKQIIQDYHRYYLITSFVIPAHAGI